MPRLLIVDDDAQLGRMLGEFLAGEGLAVRHVESGPAAIELLACESFDLVILDVMLPGLSGFDVLQRLRLAGDTPVLMLTARGDEDDKVLGLELGADDYLAKPFSARELAARVRAILRRTPSGAASRSAIEAGPLKLDPGRLSASLEGRAVKLTSAEFMVLEVLARAAGRAQSRALLTQQALGRRLEAYDRSIDTHVSNLRRKLGPAAGLEIRSLRRHGYVLSVQEGAE
jgi:two-component system response regulator CpxR